MSNVDKQPMLRVVHACDACGAESAREVVMHGRVIGRRCPECWARIERQCAAIAAMLKEGTPENAAMHWSRWSADRGKA